MRTIVASPAAGDQKHFSALYAGVGPQADLNYEQNELRLFASHGATA